MSIRLQMLQVARLARPRQLGDAAELVERFVRDRLDASGGFVDRAGKPDLYYTVFGIDCLLALQAEVPSEHIRRYLESFNNGEALNYLHLTCLARCYAALPNTQVPEAVRDRVIEQMQQHRKDEGGYDTELDSDHGSAYGCFVSIAACQDVGASLPPSDAIQSCLSALQSEDGGYANDQDIPLGSVPATAAAITASRALHLAAPQNGVAFLKSCFHEQGGMIALPGAPMPDLLSTAVGLHALSSANVDIQPAIEPCLDFLDTLWTARGSFYPTWAEEDDALDVEYTFYALLALGHLSV